MIKADRAAFDGDVVDRYHLPGQVPPEARSMVIAPCERLARNSAGGLKSSLRLSRCSGRIVRVFHSMGELAGGLSGWPYPRQRGRGHEWGSCSVVVGWIPCDCPAALAGPGKRHPRVHCATD